MLSTHWSTSCVSCLFIKRESFLAQSKRSSVISLVFLVCAKYFFQPIKFWETMRRKDHLTSAKRSFLYFLCPVVDAGPSFSKSSAKLPLLHWQTIKRPTQDSIFTVNKSFIKDNPVDTKRLLNVVWMSSVLTLQFDVVSTSKQRRVSTR